MTQIVQNKDDRHEMFRPFDNPHRGPIVQIDGDMRFYCMQADQKWRPHLVITARHPATIGDMVTLDNLLARYLGVQIGIVSGIRCIREIKTCPPIRQVELLGLPCRWFGIGHFEEYDWHRHPNIGFRMYESILTIGS